MIERKKELDSLRQAYADMTRTGHLHLRLICGEAGTGKTMLARSFVDEHEKPDADKTLFITGYCTMPSDYSIPYQPFKELMKNLLQDVNEETEREAGSLSGKFKESLKFCGKALVRYAPDLITGFIPAGQQIINPILKEIGQALLKEDPDKDKPVTVEEGKIMEQYLDAVRAISARYRLVLFIDDMQWIDASSVNLLYQLVKGLQRHPVMILGCYRSTEVNLIADGKEHAITRFLNETKIGFANAFIDLDRLKPADRRELMDCMLDSEQNRYDRHFRQKFFEQTNGNPLFVSELLSLLKEEGMVSLNDDGLWVNQADVHWSNYPVRIEGIIRERIGHLEESLVEILSHASVQGYSFIAQVLSKTMDKPERDLLLTLSKNLQKQHKLIHEGECFRLKKNIVSSFNFSNYIFRQYLYEELSMTQRMLLHSDVASILEELFKDNLELVAADIARHYELSGEQEKAIPYIRMTVVQMMRVAACVEAGKLSRKALEYLEEMADTEEVKKEILFFMVCLCVAYRSTRGWGDPELVEVCDAAMKLCDELQDDTYRSIIEFTAWCSCLSRLQLEDCQRLACTMLQSSREKENPVLELSATVSMGNSLFWLGRFSEAETLFLPWLEQGARAVDERNELDPLFIQMFALLIATQKDEKEKMALMNTQLEAMLERNKNPFCKAIMYQAFAWASYFTEEKVKLVEYARNLVQISQEYHFHPYEGVGRLFHGFCLSRQDYEGGIREIEKGYEILVNHCQSEPVAMNSVYGHVLGTVTLEARDFDRFSVCMEKTLGFAEARRERAYLDELYFLKARYHQEMHEPELARQYFDLAVSIAEENGSRKNLKAH